VNVAELQQHIRSLGLFLASVGSRPAAAELEYLSERLAPFQGQKLKAFADFLTAAEARARGEPPPGRKPPKPRKLAKDPRQATDRVFQAYTRATDPTLTRDEIEAAVADLDGLKKTDLDGLARRIEIGQKFGKIADVVQAIRQKIFDRKGAFERAPA
jgi:hypothetical protein